MERSHSSPQLSRTSVLFLTNGFPTQIDGLVAKTQTRGTAHKRGTEETTKDSTERPRLSSTKKKRMTIGLNSESGVILLALYKVHKPAVSQR